MAYYAQTFGKIILPKENLETAYERMCELNGHNELKEGGAYPKEGQKPESSCSLGHPDYWFSWMPWDYDDKFSTAKEIIEELGFEADETSEGLEIHSFDGKTGQEELFFRSIGDLLKPGHSMLWIGESDAEWRWEADYGKLYVHG